MLQVPCGRRSLCTGSRGRYGGQFRLACRTSHAAVSRCLCRVLFHIVTHFKSDDFTVEAVEDGRNIELSVSTLDLGDISKQLLQWFVCTEISLDQILSVLSFGISLGDTVRFTMSVDCGILF